MYAICKIEGHAGPDDPGRGLIPPPASDRLGRAPPADAFRAKCIQSCYESVTASARAAIFHASPPTLTLRSTLLHGESSCMRKLLLSAISALALAASTAFAQSGTTVTGRVTSDAGVPLGGASVFIAGTNIGAQTSDDGSYPFVVPAGRAPGGPATLTARVIGSTSQSSPVTLSPGAAVNQSFSLAVNPFHLGEVVVTGAGTTTTRERLGVTINRVDSSTIRRAAEPQNIVASLAAKAPNVVVRTQSGEPGAGASVQIRGAASLTGTNQPLFVVDGQPIDNQTVSTAFLAVNGGSLGDRQGGIATPNRAADINPADVENIEILKGSAASAIYGARAANGVILITTKRGHTGPTRISMSSSATVDKRPLTI